VADPVKRIRALLELFFCDLPYMLFVVVLFFFAALWDIFKPEERWD
jgi:hypothetical protein